MTDVLPCQAKEKMAKQPTHIRKDFGKWIKKLRLAKGEARGHRMTVQELADMADISRVFLQRVEAGDGVSSVTVSKLAQALGVDEREALERAGFSAGFTAKDAQLPISLIHFKYLSPETQKLILDQVEYWYEKESPARLQSEPATKPAIKPAVSRRNGKTRR